MTRIQKDITVKTHKTDVEYYNYISLTATRVTTRSKTKIV